MKLDIFILKTGTVSVVTVFVLKIPDLNTQGIANALEWMFYIFIPNFGFANGLQEIYNNYAAINTCKNFDEVALGIAPSVEQFCVALKSYNSTERLMSCCPQKGEHYFFLLLD